MIFQFNIATMRAPYDDSLFDDFKVWLKALHALAEVTDGFIWRYQGEKDEGGYIQPYEDKPLVLGNMSVWRDYNSLYEYTFADGHLEMMKNKRKWFEKPEGPYSVLYYGEDELLARPLKEAKKRLALLVAQGETLQAFGFGSQWIND